MRGIAAAFLFTATEHRGVRASQHSCDALVLAGAAHDTGAKAHEGKNPDGACAWWHEGLIVVFLYCCSAANGFAHPGAVHVLSRQEPLQ